MKKHLKSCILFLTVISIFLHSTYVFSSMQLFQKGMSGIHVSEIQNKLKELGFFNLEPTGFFGSVTEVSVKRFQSGNGLISDGIIGPESYNKMLLLLNKFAFSNIVLKKGMNRIEVTQLQSSLKELGYFNYHITSYFGQITESAVKKFQSEHGLVNDGIAGMNTSKKIVSLLSMPVLRKGMTSAEVYALQSNLQILNYFNLNPTGYFGDITEQSIKNFQRQNGLAANGIADLITHNKISNLLSKHKIIVIDPGHGGIDIGTSRGSLRESRINLVISMKLKDYLTDSGYTVILTRYSDVALDHLSNISDTRERKDLDARVKIINSSNAYMFLNIHINSVPQWPSASGSIVFYNNNITGSKVLAQRTQGELNNIVVNGVKRKANISRVDDFYLINNSNIPGLLIEAAFITNNAEYDLLKTDDFLRKLAKAIVNGVN